METKKYRMKNWYWGKFVTKKEANSYVDEEGHGLEINDSNLEIYSEKLHGWQHSEEFKREIKNDKGSK